jgi:hypothetical protein
MTREMIPAAWEARRQPLLQFTLLLVPHHDLTFLFFEVDSSGNYSEKGPPKWQNGHPSFSLPSGLEKLTITADDVAVFTGRDSKETKYPLR